ncbi:hypothetical protein FS837_012482 [Tulasnella sp. UAMH 9824]|nr:hypothetical protein FS837_012482 [Tulasnella sp. UAMH 9824]
MLRLLRFQPKLIITKQYTKLRLQSYHGGTEGRALARLDQPTTRALVPFRQTTGKDTITLRPYQEDCINTCIEVITSGAGITRIGVSLPPGSGKTVMFCTLISLLPSPKDRPNASKSLILVDSIELAKQAAEQLSAICPHLTVEIEQGKARRATGSADVTVATYQTLNIFERLSKFDPSLFKVVVVDEAHHAAAPSYVKILSLFNSEIVAFRHSNTLISTSSLNPGQLAVPIIGVSATFARQDDLELGSVFQNVVYHKNYSEMRDEGWLCPLSFTTVRTEIDLSAASTISNNGDFSPAVLASAMNTTPLNKLVVETFRKSALVFCVDIDHVKALTAAFRDCGVDARMITAKTPEVERTELLTAFSDGKFPVLVNCSILTEGIDLPNIDCIIIARPTRSKNLFWQIIGRGMRHSPKTGKKDCRIIDLVDSLERVGGIISGPSLFRQEPDEIIDGFMKVEETKELLSHRSISKFDVYYFPSDVKECTDEKARGSPKHPTHLATAFTPREALRIADRYVAKEIFPGKGIRPSLLINTGSHSSGFTEMRSGGMSQLPVLN